ncbi:MAG TPA: hypothetical protein VFC07_15065 [Verrucomicrobiae bacterium]|nr:hypothetical protein [Verrucomicrobiae bacterium]
MKRLMGILSIFSTLFGTSCSKNTVRVEFINAKDKSVIAVSEMSPEQLPDSFAIDTTFNLKNSKWAVVTADPIEKSKFAQTRKLRIFLSPISMGVPDDILFSLPTISDDVGTAAGNALPNEKIFSIHEDDWRQLEFVSQGLAHEIQLEIADIQNIYQKERSEAGFKKVHVRERIPNPFENRPITLAELESIFHPQEKFEAVGFQRTRGTIPNSFAWKLDRDLILWGVTDQSGKIERLCVQGAPASENIALFSKAFSSFNSQYELIFVDWCRTTKISSDVPAFAGYFQKQ